MSVVILLTGRIWTSVSATELNDHITNDGLLQGPTYIARDQVGIPPEESQLYKNMSARMIKEKVWSTNYPPAVVIAKLISSGYKLICQAGTGIGFSGKARYSADVAVTDYRWSWTLVKDDTAPPPYREPIVVILLTGRNWTNAYPTLDSIRNPELIDHINNDGLLQGPTYIARDQVSIPSEESQLYENMDVTKVREKVWSTKFPPAVVIAKLISSGYNLICQAGTGIGFSGKAQYSEDATVTDYRWSWTLVKNDTHRHPIGNQSVDMNE